MLPSTVPVSFYITNVLTYTYSDTNKRAFNPVAREACAQLVMRAASNPVARGAYIQLVMRAASNPVARGAYVHERDSCANKMLPSTVPASSYITNVLTYTYSDTNKRAFNPVAREACAQLVMRAASNPVVRAAFNESSPEDRQEERMSREQHSTRR